MNIPDDQHLAQISKRLRTSSAVVPALIFCLISMPTGVAGLLFGPESSRALFSILVATPMILAVSQIIFFTFFDRDRLQNEDHVERKILLGRMNPKIGDANVTVELSADGHLTHNPAIVDHTDV